MTPREAIETSLASWRDAERRLVDAVDGDRDETAREVKRYRAEFHRLSADHMVEQIDKLKEAESRRLHATPSTVPFHEAARDTQEIASEIWEAARESDEDTPQTVENHRRSASPKAPGS